MQMPRIQWSAVVLVLLSGFLTVRLAQAITVKVGTSSGASTSATYYTQDGDRATGDARVSSTGGVSLSTAGSVEKGLVRAESGAGDRAFTPYTGDFSATATAGAGSASSSATFSDPRVDIFVASDPATRTIVNYDPSAIYSSIGAAVAAAGAEVGVGADWILVDQGIYNERVVMDDAVADFEDNSALTCAWCGGDTIIDGTGTANDLVDIDRIDGFRMEGFTITNADETGIAVGQSNGAQIICNSVTNSGYDGINVRNSTGAEITNNIVTNSGFGGISVISSNNAQIRNNNVTDSGQPGISVINSASARITDNAVSDVTSTGIMVLGGNNVGIRNNAVMDTTTQGIWVSGSPNAQITANNVTTAGTRGIDVSISPGTQITRNTVANSGSTGIDVTGCNGVQITDNTVTNSWLSGIRLGSSDDARITNNVVSGNYRSPLKAAQDGVIVVTGGSDRAQITNNRVTENGHNGIWVGNSSNDAVIDENIVTSNDLDGITVYSALRADVTNNHIADNQRNGIALVFGSHGAEIRNNMVADNQWDGIYVGNSNGAQITSNSIAGNGQNSVDNGGIHLVGGPPVATTAAINGNNIEGNVDFGLRNATAGNVNATNNWWGNASGPSGIGPGTGDAIQNSGGGTVIYFPWAPTPFPLP